jgi:4-hydroxybenzoate polyprenyltransferase
MINYLSQRIYYYALLMRLHKPIGILLLLWPTLWALWISSHGFPQMKILAIFVAGVILMRSAGCIINDIADRKFDGYVKRTQARPLVIGQVSLKEAFVLLGILLTIAFILVLFLHPLTWLLAVIAVLMTAIYPFLKRYTHLPQLMLGFAFSWGIPMAFAAVLNKIPALAWWLLIITCLWIIVYDTFYAMADREDDVKIGVKSTAILFGKWDKLITASLQSIIIMAFIAIGLILSFTVYYYIALLMAALFFIYQQYLIKDRVAEKCLTAFLNNNWFGLVIFLGVTLNYYL